MIIELLLTPIFFIVNGLISLLPKMGELPSWVNDFLNVVSTGLTIFPIDVWIFAIGSIVFWRFGLIAWSVVEWLYKKIPGVS